MIRIKNLFLKYTREYFALYDISFNVEKNERVAFLGDEDSGKTSLIRIITKLEEPTSGEVYIKDIPLKKLNLLHDIQAGYLPATPVLLENKTVYENLKYILSQRKLSKSEIESKINQALINFSLERIRDEKVKNLKLLDKYIVSFARLLFRDLELLIIDNIFEKLPPHEREEMIKLVESFLDGKKLTLIFALREKELAKRFGLKVITFDNGSIVK